MTLATNTKMPFVIYDVSYGHEVSAVKTNIIIGTTEPFKLELDANERSQLTIETRYVLFGGHFDTCGR